MNNQVKLIDAEKLLSWLSERMSGSGSDDRYYAFEWVHEVVESGEFDPDTPPVPTIKPGDKVKYTGWQFKDEVDTAIVDHLRVQALATYAVIESGKKYYIVPLNHLEVVE